jgi:hypothetical protein
MSGPTGQHFLPRQAYLRFFCSPANPGKIYLYRRGSSPVLTNTFNVGKTRHLYSFSDDSGRLNHKIETSVLAPLDTSIQPVIERLNKGDGAVQLDRAEAETLIVFLAFQLVRTPAFRDHLYRFDSAMASTVRTAVKPGEIKDFLAREMGLIPPDDEIERYWESVSQGLIERISPTEYWLAHMSKLARSFVDAIELKSPQILRTPYEYFITSDFPIVLREGMNLTESDLFFPVGSHAALYLSARPRQKLGSALDLPVRRISSQQARTLNKSVVRWAENYLYAAVERMGLCQLFDRTRPPERMRAPSAPRTTDRASISS